MYIGSKIRNVSTMVRHHIHSISRSKPVTLFRVLKFHFPPTFMSKVLVTLIGTHKIPEQNRVSPQ